MTISMGPIRFLRSASRNSATVLASTPALRAGRDAVRAVVFAALRAFCWRPRACPPFLAAAVRLVLDEDRALDEERVRLVADLPPEDLLLDDLLLEALLPDERVEPLDFFLPPEPPLLRRSAMSRSPSGAAVVWSRLTPWSGTISPRTLR
jgi:hypothetical protein